jgi:hypothetical protein
MKKIIIEKGKRFGYLIVIDEEFNSNRRKFNCLCDCGNLKKIQLNHLMSGDITSCGCKKIEICGNNFRTHGLSKSAEFNTWSLMKKRCYNKNDKRYNDWGGRGITVCESWLDSFENFIKDMGFKPSKEHSIDRINNDGNYEPSNCRWATRSEQMKNRRKFKRSKRKITQ